MRKRLLLIIATCLSGLMAGCGEDPPRGEAESDTAFGEVPQTSQTPGQGRIDSGGGATAGGFPPDARTNYTEPDTGVRKDP